MTTQAPIDPRHTESQQKAPRVEVYWTAITYKTVILYVLLAMVIISAGIYLAKPAWPSIIIKKFSKAVSGSDNATVSGDQKHTTFGNRDGTDAGKTAKTL